MKGSACAKARKRDLSVLGSAGGEEGWSHAGDEIREIRARGQVALWVPLPSWSALVLSLLRKIITPEQ